MRRSRGFTLIELIVVIAIIGILIAITVIGFGRYQADTRDARRASSVSVIVEGLEKYYDNHGEYPSCSAVSANATTVSNNTLIGIDPNVLVAPQASNVQAGQTNSIECTSAGNVLSMSGPDFFEYQGDGSDSCNTNGSCLNYVLKYKSETTNQIISIKSRRDTSIATSGDITNLTANASSFSSIVLNWQKIANATSYTIQQADDSGFTANVSNYSSTTNTDTATGLVAGNTYYFRVMPIGAAGTANWSNTANATTNALATPVITATANSNSQITVNWQDIQYESSYTLQYTTNGSSWTTPAPTVVANIPANSISYAVTGLSTGVQYFFRLQAIATGDTSAWSNSASATTFVPAPSITSLSVDSSTQITANWSNVSVADSYTLQYSPTSDFSSSVTTITGLTATSRANTGLTQGLTYYFRVYALVGSVQSSPSPTVSATTTVDTPGAPSITAYRPGAVRAESAGAWIKDPGAGNYYYAYANAGVSCPAGNYTVYQFEANYNASAAGDPGPSDPAYTGATTTTTWYLTQPISGYKVKFGARAYCQGPSTNSSWGGWNYSCAADPGSTVACTF